MHILIILGIALGFFLLGMEALNAFTEHNMWQDVFNVLGTFWDMIDAVAIPVAIMAAILFLIVSWTAVKIGEGLAAEVTG